MKPLYVNGKPFESIKGAMLANGWDAGFRTMLAKAIKEQDVFIYKGKCFTVSLTPPLQVVKPPQADPAPESGPELKKHCLLPHLCTCRLGVDNGDHRA